jgi:hypothetical protein
MTQAEIRVNPGSAGKTGLDAIAAYQTMEYANVTAPLP